MTGSVYDDDGFAHYIVESNETPVAYVAVVSLFVAVSVSIAAPIACWSRERARQRQMGGTVAPTAETAERTEQHPSRSESSPEMVSDLVCVQPHLDSSKVATLSVFHREHLAAMKQLAQEKLSSLHHKARVSDTNIADRLSAVPSVASSTQIHAQRRTFLSRMPWSHGRTLPRSDTVQRFVQLERQSQVSGEGSHSGRSFNSWAAGQSQLTGVRCVSDAGRTFLDGEAIKGEAQHYRLRYIKQYRNHDKRSLRHESTRKYSLGGRSCDGSVMPPLDPDAVSPHDAADANDPGQLFNPIQYKAHNATLTDQTSQSLQPQRAILAQFSNILDLAEVNYESKRILSLAIPSTIGAMADPLCRIVLVSIISHFIDTDSMVAYLLVILFLRLTTHGISGAIVDAETNMVQDALDRGGDLGLFQAGQTIQLAIFFQVIIGGPILLIWVFVMENVVDWLVSDNKIAEIASTYTSVIIIEYVLKGVSKSFMLPFDLTGQAQFEAHVELLATIMTGIAIAIVATTNDLSLPAIGWIQVIMGIAKAIMKVAFVALRGWLLPYRIGLWKDCAIKDTASLVNFLLQAFPLFLGSLLDLGEWEVLSLFVSSLGGAEVTTWVMMGVIWEIFAGLSEGLGEAASVRVSFHLARGMPTEAKKLSNKIAYIAFVLVLGVTSMFLMAGPNIAVALTTDSTIQHLFTQLVGLTGLANVSMTFAQVYWSLAGAQCRFSLASGTILFCRWIVILPFASVCIYRYSFDLMAVAGAVAVGYAVASISLAWIVFRSDWDILALSMHENFGVPNFNAGGGGGEYHDDEAEGGEGDDEGLSSSSGVELLKSPSSSEESESQHDGTDDHELL